MEGPKGEKWTVAKVGGPSKVDEQCEQFTLSEQCEQRTVRTVHFLKIVEQGEQVRTLFGGA